MNKQQIMAAVQSVISSNRRVISVLHVDAKYVKDLKKAADANNNLDMEYYYHDYLQKLKNQLRLEVRNQRALKRILKALQFGENV